MHWVPINSAQDIWIYEWNNVCKRTTNNCSTNVCDVVHCWTSVICGEGNHVIFSSPIFFYSCSSGRLGVFCWLHLCIVRVIEEIKDLCSLAFDSFTFVQPAPETQRMGWEICDRIVSITISNVSLKRQTF